VRFFILLSYILTISLSSNITAIGLSEDGTGQVLLYPYYTVADKQDTLISITNIQKNTKLVRFNVRESLNSQLVYSFDLILRPNDNWSAAITLRDDGATLVSADTACTMPAELAGKAGKLGQRALFSKNNYQTDLQNTGIERTQTGHIEVIEMGVLSSELASKAAPPQRDCASIQTQYDDIAAQLTRPTGGLHGYGVIINPEQGTAVNYDAEALVDFSARSLYRPLSSGKPDLGSGSSTIAYIKTPTGPFQQPFDSGADAVSAVLTKTKLTNDFVLDESINSRSYWVVTLPTKYLYTQRSEPTEPFGVLWDPETTKACIGYIPYPLINGATGKNTLQVFDREAKDYSNNECQKRRAQLGSGFSTTLPSSVCVKHVETFCYGASLLNLNNSNNFSSANIDETSSRPGLFTVYPAPPFSGTLHYKMHSMPTHKIRSSWNDDVLGLPSIGFAVQVYVNGSLNGTIANYAVSTKHKTLTQVVDN